MPLRKARRRTKKALRKAISANMRTLSREGGRKRSQMIAIALRAAGAPRRRARRRTRRRR